LCEQRCKVLWLLFEARMGQRAKKKVLETLLFSLYFALPYVGVSEGT